MPITVSRDAPPGAGNWCSSSFDLAHGLVVCELDELLDAEVFPPDAGGENPAGVDPLSHRFNAKPLDAIAENPSPNQR